MALWQRIAIGFAVGALVLFSVLWNTVLDKTPEENPFEARPVVEEAPADAIYIDIKGEVLKPGVYKVDPAMRLFQVVAKAGGLTRHADADSMSLAQTLSDGEAYRIPSLSETEEERTKDESPGRICINGADHGTLTTLPNIGDATAANIIEHRRTHGDFTSVEGLLDVANIGESTLETIKDLITV